MDKVGQQEINIERPSAETVRGNVCRIPQPLQGVHAQVQQTPGKPQVVVMSFAALQKLLDARKQQRHAFDWHS